MVMGDGVAGGDFNFWFRTAAPVGLAAPNTPKTVFVDKGYTVVDPTFTRGSICIAACRPGALASGDVLSRSCSVGTDNSVTTASDNPAYEIGRGVRAMRFCPTV